MGGTDSPDNLVYLTVEEHCEAHQILWHLYKRQGDKIAFIALDGQISISLLSKMKQKIGQQRGGLRNVETGHLARIRSKEASAKGGRKHSTAHLKGVPSNGCRIKKSMGGKKGGKIAGKITSAMTILCHDCGMISSPAGIGSHQKKTGHILKERI